jgi:hypothetical protein
MRTTLDIDDPILRDLKRLQKREGKSLGRLVSDLLAMALGQMKSRKAPVREFKWISLPMGARVNLADPEAVISVMEEARPPGSRRGSSRS